MSAMTLVKVLDIMKWGDLKMGHLIFSILNYKMAVKLAGYSQSQYAMHLEASFLGKN